MSVSSLRSALGIGIQSAKGTPATSFTYVPVLNANLMGEQLAQTIPPEVGGSYFARGSYKAGLRARGDVAMVLRPGTIGWFLAGLFNTEALVTSGGVPAGMTDHLFTVGDNAANKWLSFRRMIGSLYGEQMTDARVGSFRIEVAAANIANASVQLIGANHQEIASPGNTYAADGPVFETCIATVELDAGPFIVDRLMIEIGQQLTDNEFHVGSFFLDDITTLQRAVTIQADVRVKDRSLMSKVYRNGAAAPSGSATGAWNPFIYTAPLKVVLNTSEAEPQQLTIDLASIDFLTFPVQVQGADLVRAQLSANVTLNDDNFDSSDPDGYAKQPVIVTLRNEKIDKYSYNGS